MADDACVNPYAVRVVGSPKVWVTLVTNQVYMPGLLALNHSLKKSDSKYPLVAIYTENLPPRCLKALDVRGIPKKQVIYLQPESQRDFSNDPRFYDTWTKLVAFSLIEYERVVLLDSDMIVLQNMDELMDVPLDAASDRAKGNRVFAASHACTCNPLKKAHYPRDWVPENCAYTRQHTDPERAQVEASPSSAGIGMLNSGALVIVPSNAAYDMIAERMTDSQAMETYEFPDQGLLSDVFRNRWVALPYVYNALKILRWKEAHAAIWRDDRVKNVHYIWSPKPWQLKDGDEADETYKWWYAVDDDRREKEKALEIHDGF